GTPVIGLAVLITSFFFVLPLGRYSVGSTLTDFRVYDFAFIGFMLVFGLRHLGRLQALWKDKSSFHYWAMVLLVLVWLSLIITGIDRGLLPLLAGALRASRF